MQKWIGVLATLVLLFAAVSCATAEPTVAPTAEPAATAEQAMVEPTEAPVVEVNGTGMTMEELEAAAVELTPEELALWNVTYTLPDGTVITPGTTPKAPTTLTDVTRASDAAVRPDDHALEDDGAKLVG